MTVIKEGALAPDFSLRDMNGVIHTLGEVQGNFKVVYFYPKDSTPGCIIEAQEFSRDAQLFAAKEAAIIGISGGSDKSKAKFCQRYQLNLLLLSDPDLLVSKKYGAYFDKGFLGLKFKGVSRKTYLLDSNGKVLKVWEKVKARGHSAEVLDKITQVSDH